MNRAAHIRTTTRSARFTSAAHDEVELIYPFEALEGHQDNGKPQYGYYSAERYASKQLEHGHEIYPEPAPFTDGNFKR